MPMIVVPAALVVLGIYVIQGLSLSAVPQIYEIEWIKVIPYLIVLGTAITGVNVMVVSDMKERLSPKNEPPTTMAVI